MNNNRIHIEWVDGLKAFAIIAILLNHFVESFGLFPWFSFPSYDWPDLGTRISAILPSEGPLTWRIVQFLGWLGDMGPGIFIFLSGFSLTFSALQKNEKGIDLKNFYWSRLIRIFPLYLVIHILVMVSGAFLGDKSYDFFSSRMFLSMLGLRASDGLFFFINPSWWFIWLIIQLYVIFPFLYRYLVRAGIPAFILISAGFTILSRLAGLLNITYSSRLEWWMMGLFFGTRLFEFTIGMVLAKLFLEKRFDPSKISILKLSFVSLALYVLGFVASLFYPTTLISSAIITIGLSGLFLSIWKTIDAYLPLLKRPIVWAGVASFPVFLIHQPYLGWLSRGFSGLNKAFILIFILFLAFPIGRFIELIVNKTITSLPRIKNKIIITSILISLTVQVLLNILFFFTQQHSVYKLDVLIFIINIFFIPLYFLLGNKIKNLNLQILLWTFLPSSLVFCFILTSNWFNIFWIFIIIQLAVVILISMLTENVFVRFTLPSVLVFVLFLSGEYYLAKNHPVEVNRWGEFPSLQKDSVTVYTLIPNKETHLKYNNYDYFVKTNSMGFNGPDIDLSFKDSRELRILIIGDAFTMPEGLEYPKAYPELLRASLSELYPERIIKVFNAGVTGFGPNEEFAQLSKYIDTIKPDLYINEMFINEFDEINLDSTARLNSLKFSKLPFRNELFSGNQIPFQVSFEIDKLLKDNNYLNYIYFKSLAYFYEKNSILFTEKNKNKLKNYFLNVKALCESKNCKVVTLYAPGQLEISTPADIDYYPHHISLNDTSKYDLDLPRKIMKELSNNAGIPFLDPTKRLRSNLIQPVYFRGSWHWNSEGHKVIADFVDQEIQNQLKFK